MPLPGLGCRRGRGCLRLLAPSSAAGPGEGFVMQGGVCRCQTGNRHPIGRAGYVIQASLVTELNRGWVSAVFSTNANLQVWPGSAPFAHGQLNQKPDSPLVQGE